MPIPVLTDADIPPLLDMRELIPLMEEFLRSHHAGHAVAPPRHTVAFEPDGKLVFTIGGLTSAHRALAGFRVYDTFKTIDAGHDAQIVAVWDRGRGSLLGLVLGESLGEWRTGALGGLAIRYMSRQEARSCAVLGTGRQARTQLLAAAACRPLAEVRVYGRDQERRRRFAAELAAATGLNIQAAASAREAVEQADLVLCATSSSKPVLETSWLSPGAHVNTLGPKTLDAHELPVDIAERVTLLATDSIEQVNAYSRPYFLAGSPAWSRLRNLADLVAEGVIPASSGEGVSLFCSAGLAGTEIIAAAHVLERHRAAC